MLSSFVSVPQCYTVSVSQTNVDISAVVMHWRYLSAGGHYRRSQVALKGLGNEVAQVARPVYSYSTLPNYEGVTK